MFTSAPGGWDDALVGARRWFIVFVGLGLVTCGAYLLLPQRIEGSWYFSGQGQRSSQAVLLIDTRGGPLRSEGGATGSSWADGNAAPGFVIDGIARAGRENPLTMRLVEPAGRVVWVRAVPVGDRMRLPTTRLDRLGVWRFEVEARSRTASVTLIGAGRASRWSLARSGPAMPIGLIIAGVVAAVVVWLGRIGSRVAGAVLLVVGLSVPLLLSLFRELLVAYPPGTKGVLGVATAVCVGGGLALGWTWPHREGPPPYRSDLVLASAGALLVAFVSTRPWYELLRPAYEVILGVGLLLIATGVWRVGRRSATTGSGRTARVVWFALLGSACVAMGACLLVGGVILAIIVGSGIGPSDNGPDRAMSLGILCVVLPVSSGLALAALRCFRAAGSPRSSPTPEAPRFGGDVRSEPGPKASTGPLSP